MPNSSDTNPNSADKLLTNSIGKVYAKVDGLSVILVVKANVVKESLFSADLLGVIDSQSSETIISGAGHPNVEKLDDVPSQNFWNI